MDNGHHWLVYVVVENIVDQLVVCASVYLSVLHEGGVAALY